MRHTLATFFDKLNLNNAQRRYLALVAQHSRVTHDVVYTHHEFRQHIATFQQHVISRLAP